MQDDHFIAAEEFCSHYSVSLSFLESLQEHGLIRIESVQEQKKIPIDDLRELEKFIHLHFDMDINFEGIEAIQHLLEKLQDMSREINELRNRVRMYE